MFAVKGTPVIIFIGTLCILIHECICNFLFSPNWSQKYFHIVASVVFRNSQFRNKFLILHFQHFYRIFTVLLSIFQSLGTTSKLACEPALLFSRSSIPEMLLLWLNHLFSVKYETIQHSESWQYQISRILIFKFGSHLKSVLKVNFLNYVHGNEKFKWKDVSNQRPIAIIPNLFEYVVSEMICSDVVIVTNLIRLTYLVSSASPAMDSSLQVSTAYAALAKDLDSLHHSILHGKLQRFTLH